MNKFTLFDIGANWGQDSLANTKNNPNYEIWAFEPISELYHHLDKSRKDGGFENRYHLFPLAISDYDGESTFYIADSDPVGDWGASSLYPFVENVGSTWPGRADLKTTRTITVDVSRIDTWYKANNIKLEKIDYLHCDTQGSDLRVLKGMGDLVYLIQEGVVECARDNNGKLYHENHTVQEMQDFLNDHGFAILRTEPNDPWSNELNLYFKKK